MGVEITPRETPADPTSAWSREHVALVDADIGAWTWEIEPDRIHGSPRAHALLAPDPERLGGTLAAFLARIHAEDRGAVTAHIERALAQGPDEWQLEHRVAGSVPERWVRQRGRIVRGPEGEPVRMVGIMELVGARTASERAQREQAALMQAALDASVFAVVVIEPSGHIIFCNELAGKLLGLTPSAVRARTYDAPQWKHSDVDGGPWPEEKLPFSRVLATGAPVYGIEHRIERPDGVSTVLRVNGAPVKDERGEIRLLVFSFEDVTERRAAEEGLRQAQRMEAIGRLAAGVAHDFNNLLTVIMSSAVLAQEELDQPNRVLDYLGYIVDAGARAAALTGQLLMLNRRDAGSTEAFDLREELTLSARLIERVVGERVVVRIDEGPDPCWVKLDRGQLNQVLINLAVNARDAMPEGGQLRFAAVRLLASSRVRVTVSDTGQGMDESTLRRAFEPFFTTKPVHKGTGLGLPTAHEIVRHAGGSIDIQSALGRGTTVTIELPLVDEPPVPARPPARGSRPPGNLHLRALVVEDEPIVRMLGVRALRQAGFEVEGAASAEQALELIEARNYELLISDVILSGLDGLELARRARAKRPRIKVLLVSGYTGEASLGDESVLAKPFTPETLVAAVERLCAHG